MSKRISQIEFVIASAILVVIVMLVFMAAILRFFDHPLIWSVDVAQLLFIWLCMFGAARAMREKGHLGIDFVVRKLPLKARLALELVLSLLVLAFLAALAVKGTELTFSDYQRQFGDSGISYSWVTAAVPVGAVMIGLGLLNNIRRAFLEWRAGRLELIYSRIDQPAPETLEVL